MSDNLDSIVFSNKFVFNQVMKDPEICREVLQTLLKIKIHKIEYLETEKTIEAAFKSHGIRLDVYVEDSDKVYDVEIQNYDGDDLPFRMRYYQSLIDADALIRGTDYSELKDSFIIFICTFDPFGAGLPCYTFSNMCLDACFSEPFPLDDGATKIIFNATAYSREKDVEIQNFLKYTFNKGSSDSLTSKIDSKVTLLKDSKTFRESYTYLSDEFKLVSKRAHKEGLEQGLEQGIQQSKTEMAQ